MQVISFGGVRDVPGSCHILDTGRGKILVDCGIYQGSPDAEERNREPFGFDVSEIQAVFVTHPHADHVGRLPKLVKDGFAGPVFMTPPAQALARLILEDEVHIMQQDLKWKGLEPFFEMDDVNALFAQVKSVGYHEEVRPMDGVRAQFHDAGHVLGSSFISFDVDGKTVVFSGDIGNDDVPILPDTETLHGANLVVCESTYGDREHEPHNTRREKLIEHIRATVEEKGVLLIPAFSIERTQEVLYEIDRILLEDLKTNVPIFLDSPMAIRATQAYRDFKQYLRFDTPILAEPDRDFFSFPNLRETLTRDESKVINEVPFPKIIIAGSGMMSGGRIMYHLEQHLPNPKCRLLIIGYQAEGTVGRAIQDGAKSVTIRKEEVEVNAIIDKIGSFSAHGDRNKLTRWLQSANEGKGPGQVVLVHGDEDQKIAFKAHLENELGVRVTIAEFNQPIQVN